MSTPDKKIDNNEENTNPGTGKTKKIDNNEEKTNPGTGKTKSPKDKKKFYQNPKFWIVTGVIVALVVVAVVVAVVLYNEQHKKAVERYEEAWGNYEAAQNDFGFEYGAMLGEMGFSMDENAQYKLDEETIYELSKECARKVDIYKEIYDNPFAVKDNDISKKSLSYILAAVDTLTVNTKKITEAKDSIAQCKEIGQEKKDKMDKERMDKEAEEKAKAEEEAEKARQKEEAQAAYNRNVLTYDKFNNQIKEGMTLNAVKDVYGWFDTQCKVASQSGGYVIYSCTPGTHTSDYWAASFTFYNNVLRSKAQSGLR